MVLSADQVLSTLILVVPGFVVIAIARAGWGTSRRLGTFPLTVWSVFMSGVIDFIFIMGRGLPLPPTSAELVASVGTLQGLTVYAGLVLGIGVGIAFLLRFNIRWAFGRLVWLGSDAMMVPSLLWDDVLEAYHQQWILAELKDGRFVQGYLARFSTFEEPREILLHDPHEVAYDDAGKPEYFPMGKAFLVTERSLKGIRFLEPKA